MGVTEAKIQTVEDIYRLVWTAVVSKRPIRAIYHRRERWSALFASFTLSLSFSVMNRVMLSITRCPARSLRT
jgi:hypothetical protein